MNILSRLFHRDTVRDDVLVDQVTATVLKVHRDKALATLAEGLRRTASLSRQAKRAVLRQVVDGIERDIKRELRADPSGVSLRRLWATALETPEYVALLKDIELNTDDVQGWIDTAIKE